MAEVEVEVEVEDWAVGLEKVLERIGARFARSDPRARAGAYLRGLLSAACGRMGGRWASRPGMPRLMRCSGLLNHADWDADAVRDDLRAYVVEQLGHDAAVLVIDETGFLKNGTKSAGVARQYSGTAGRIENCQWGCSWPTPLRRGGRSSTGAGSRGGIFLVAGTNGMSRLAASRPHDSRAQSGPHRQASQGRFNTGTGSSESQANNIAVISAAT